MTAIYKSRWSDAEMAAAVAAYVGMLRHQENGRDFVKADIISELADSALAGRTRSSIQFRFQNISAVMDEAGKPFVKGYVPAKHVGEPSRELIRGMLATQGVEIDQAPKRG